MRIRNAASAGNVSVLNAARVRPPQTEFMNAGSVPNPRRPKPLRRKGAARVIAESGFEPVTDAALVEHPDGWYWVAPDGRQQFGPFESASLARADRDRASDEAVDEAETEREAEQVLQVDDAIHEERDATGADSDAGTSGEMS